jgi:urea transport system permease protein
LRFLLACLWSVGACAGGQSAASPGNPRAILVEAALAEESALQIELVQKLAGAADETAARALAAWRLGELFLHQAEDGTRIPFLLDPQKDALGRAEGIRLADGEPVLDASGAPLRFLPEELTPVDTTSKLRKAIKAALDLHDLSHPDAKVRRDAAIKLGQEQNLEHLSQFELRLRVERDSRVRKALEEAMALTQTGSEEPETRRQAIERLGELRSLNGLAALKQLQTEARADPNRVDADAALA